ncbi:hypothetical protein ABH926_003187 [Catenulispora sp. GP43]|uniref:hypothetical protein n=1 Tax=Catenulispora sp. GP43 TaxID=3156263 RepID=UPI0035170BF6
MDVTISDYLPAHYVQAVRENLADRDPHDLDIQIEECLKYLLIMSERPGGFIPLTGPGDEVWHELILQTPDYAALCEALPGRRFIHHRSLSFREYTQMRSQEEIVDEFLGWIPEYVGRFGPFTAERAQYWSFCEFLMTARGITLDQINHIGALGSASSR